MKFVISDVVAHSSRLLPGAVAPGDQRVFSPRPRCLVSEASEATTDFTDRFTCSVLGFVVHL